jgi:hypothetical protein
MIGEKFVVSALGKVIDNLAAGEHVIPGVDRVCKVPLAHELLAFCGFLRLSICAEAQLNSGRLRQN